MKARLLLAAILLFPLRGSSQMKGAADVGIDEKLGAPVALDTVLTDEDGNDVTLRRLVDKPTILLFVYFRCPGICPVLIHNLVDVVNRIPLDPGRDFRLVALSFDPADNPELAREKKANYLNQVRRPFRPDAWHFLTGKGPDSKAVADSAGFRYARQGGMYVHPGAIIVLTPKGIISRYLYGTSFVPAEVAMAIDEAAGNRVIPSVSRVLSYCYTYDPAGRRYTLSVTRVGGVAVLAFALLTALVALRGRSKRKYD
jgi:protein SCO1/2